MKLKPSPLPSPSLWNVRRPVAALRASRVLFGLLLWMTLSAEAGAAGTSLDDARARLGREDLAVGEPAAARAAFATLADKDTERLLAIGRLQLAAGAANDAGVSAEKALAVRAGLLPALVLQVEAEILAGNLPCAEPLLRAAAARGRPDGSLASGWRPGTGEVPAVGGRPGVSRRLRPGPVGRPRAAGVQCVLPRRRGGEGKRRAGELAARSPAGAGRAGRAGRG